MRINTPSSRMLRGLILLIGLTVPQFLLYGPALTGTKLLLPLDILCLPSIYIPASEVTRQVIPHNTVLSDLVLMNSMDFAAQEVRAGRYPLWNPGIFAGAPYAGHPKLSPFYALYYLFPTPVSLAWIQFLTAWVAGIGAYRFFRRTQKVGFWAAASGAWCFPLTGFFIQWQGYGLSVPVACLPWVLLAVFGVVQKAASRRSIVQLAVASAVMLLGGALDVALLCMAVSGVYGLWCLWYHGGTGLLSRQTLRTAAALAVGWGLGLAFAAPHMLPLHEYTQTGDRFVRRAAGEEERPPVGLAALPQVILPNMYGSTQKGALRVVSGNQLESSAAAYAGLLATLFLAPLAFADRRFLGAKLYWAGLAIIGLGWVLNVPGLVTIMRLPGFNSFSYNRLTFLFSFAILVLVVNGLELLISGVPIGHRWFALPAGLVLGLGAWCSYRSTHLPTEVDLVIGRAFQASPVIWGMAREDAIIHVQYFFSFYYVVALVLCILGFAGWLMVRRNLHQAWPGLALVLAPLMVGDLLVYAWDTRPLCDPALYYPPIPVLAELAQRQPAERVLGVGCLPANLCAHAGLRDIRGYDAVDPKRLMDLMALARAPNAASAPAPSYARTQFFAPDVVVSNAGAVSVSPVLSMLNVRHLIFPGLPRNGGAQSGEKDGYIVVENRAAMPRLFVPRSVRLVTDDSRRLQQLGLPEFDPAAMAYVEESPGPLPDACSGTATLVREVPNHLDVEVVMDTAGLVVLADLWDAGWKAELDGHPVPILRTNHALRGIVVQPGRHQLRFHYAPARFIRGLVLAGLALIICIGLVWPAGGLSCVTRPHQNSPA